MCKEIHEEQGHKYCHSTAMLFWAKQSFVAQHTVRSVVCVIHGHVSKEQLNPENSSLLRAAGASRCTCLLENWFWWKRGSVCTICRLQGGGGGGCQLPATLCVPYVPLTWWWNSTAVRIN